ncbi:5-formyltetrahydrofolate cyclo-ligase [Pontibacter sp. JAM-7]|uniref:5-formyltetrahydrofolate cyclo-ligase n=1 Tax=Pontibacter sp. JAM-7 TaxID=3366581 RepID=UPI003AF75FF5
MERTTLRQKIRQARRSLSTAQQHRAAEGLMRQLRNHPRFINARHIAFYLPSDGEIDPRCLLRLCWARGKTAYLPVLHPIRHNQLWFLPYRASTKLHKNCYGIDEPILRPRRLRPAWALDLVLLPLVAFDAQGNRMGMGGGYYDRTFAYRNQTRGIVGPRLIGLAHELQKVERLAVESWDIPLDMIATDQHLYPGSG